MIPAGVLARRIVKGLSEPALYRLRSRYVLSGLASRFGDGRSPLPTGFFLNVNNHCNLKCRMCDVGTEEEGSSFYQHMLEHGKDQPLSLDEWKALVDQVAPGSPTIFITTTEPLLYKDLVPLVAHVASRGLRCEVTTNGFLLERYAEPLVEAGLQGLTVSIDGDEATHDAVRGVKGSWRRAVAGLDKVREAAARHGRGPEVRINSTITGQNHGRLVETWRSLAHLKPDYFVFVQLGYVTPEMAADHNRLHPQFPMKESCESQSGRLEVDVAVLADQMARVRAEAAGATRFSFFPEMPLDRLEDYYRRPDVFIEGRRCHSLWRNAQILVNGDVIFHIRCVSNVLGNVRRDSFGKIWNSPQAVAFRKLLMGGEGLPICTRCCSIFST